MKLNNFWSRKRNWAGLAMVLVLLPGTLAAQSNLLSVVPPGKLLAPKNASITAKISVQLQNGYHVNSNRPAEDYLIPLRLTWTTTDLVTESVSYPPAKMERYQFSEKPLSVFTGDFEIATRFKVPATAAPGMKIVTGKLRYQACSHKECFPPRTVEVKLPVDIVNTAN